MTVEIFFPGDTDPDGEVLGEFARELARAMEPILPPRRAAYHNP